MRNVAAVILAIFIAAATAQSARAESLPQVNPNPSLTVEQRAAIVPCTSDTDCVVKNPRIIPDVYTIDDYIRVYGDNVQFPTIGDCSRVDWLSQDGDGRWLVPTDLNHDGFINCDSDLELGS